MTRATLFRVVLALKLFFANQPIAARYCLPRKLKRPLLDAFERLIVREMLRVLQDHFVIAASPGRKIGEMLNIRAPRRFVSR